MEPGVPSFAVQTIPKPNVSEFGKEKPLVAYARMEFVAADSVPVPEIPVYFLAGKQDLTCSYTMQKEYYDQLKAPLKGFYTFEHSAHSPLFEEPERAINIFVNNVIEGSVSMSDAA